MSESKFTKGPWVTEPHIGEKQGDESTIICNDNEVIAWVHGYVDHPGNAANARLIAAAPDLLNALEQMLVCFDSGNIEFNSQEIDTGEEPTHPWHEEWLHHARSIVSRAKGPSA